MKSELSTTPSPFKSSGFLKMGVFFLPPLGEGLPLEGIQRPSGSEPTLPSLAEASRLGVVFARELHDDAVRAGAAPRRQQTMMVPGLADRAERGFREPVIWELDGESEKQ